MRTIHSLFLTAACATATIACSERPALDGQEVVIVERGAPLSAPLPEAPADPEQAVQAPSDDPSGTAGGSRAASPGYGKEAIDELARDLAGADTASIRAIASDDGIAEEVDGVTAITWRDLSLRDLEDMEDILDKLLYPEDYGEGEAEFPERIKKHDGKRISIVGYMIVLEWKDNKVTEFMLVRDLLGCCFGGSPQPDEWIEVKVAGEGADYFPYIPVAVTGVLKIEGIEDEAGYVAGCFNVSAEKVAKDTR